MTAGPLALTGLALALLLAPAWAADHPGAELARRLGCFACHAGPGQEGGQTVSLNNLGARFSAGQLQDLLSHPRRFHPQARMPNYAHLRPQEMQDLLDFLLRLK